MSSWLRIWIWGLGGGVVLSLLMATHGFVSGFIDWPTAFGFALADVLPWALLLPAVLRLAARLPCERKTLPLSLAVHLLAAGACALVLPAISHAIASGLHLVPNGPPDFPPGPGGPPPGPPGDPEPGGLPGWLRFALVRAQFNFPAYGVIVAGALGWSYYRQAQERSQRAAELETRLSEARLQYLRSQLQPHFLFNTLHALSALVHRAPDRADEMIANLSELLRLSLRDTGGAEVTLGEELEVLACYLAIQQVRFGDRLGVTQEVPEDVRPALVPSFLLQPLVENAVRHAVEKRHQPVHVTLHAGREGESLQLRLSDDGPGLPSGGEPLREGVGLGNTRARLAALYGADQSLTLAPRPGGGVIVTCRLPWHRRAPAASA